VSLWPRIEKLLAKVERPSRYIDHELNSIHKTSEYSDALLNKRIRIGLAYPDTYEVGLPNLGLQILYEILNRRDDVAAERVYAPWKDMESLMREQGIPLFTLESHESASELDILGFTLQHELIYTNVVNMLDLAGIPVFAKDRGLESPLIIAGGPGAVNPEPMAPFIDVFAVGEGEELILEIIETYKEWKAAAGDKTDLLLKLAQLDGIYVPAFYDVKYKENGQIESVKPNRDGVSTKITRRVISDMASVDIATKPIVPFMDAVHDRCVVEVMRGCARGCRFCQAGIIYRPVRERSKEQVLAGIHDILTSTGHEEISLSSLSTADYTSIVDTLKNLNDTYSDDGISISLPSLRVDAFSINLVEEIAKVKKTGLTFAPEAGTQRLRDVINKNVTQEDIENTVRMAFERGWQKIKLYFMIGLPTETEDDLQGIVDIANRVVEIGLETLSKGARNRLQVTINVSSFAPKPHTPFQWVAQNRLEEFEQKHEFLMSSLRGKFLRYRWHDTRTSMVEGALARGDRRVADVIYKAWQLGSKFDAWTREFSFDNWTRAFEEAGLDYSFYANRERFTIDGAEVSFTDEVLPWDHIDTGCKKQFLKSEFKRALLSKKTPDCRFGDCTGCGVCQSLKVDNILHGKGD
jgi:radical SAM family uncharacterized protein